MPLVRPLPGNLVDHGRHDTDRASLNDSRRELWRRAHAIGRIRTFATVLGDANPTDDLKAYDLMWLLHIVGDVHQPLHNASQYGPVFTKPAKGKDGYEIKHKDFRFWPVQGAEKADRPLFPPPAAAE